MAFQRIRDSVLRNTRRLGDISGILERRKFQHLRAEFYAELWRTAAAEVGAELTQMDAGLTKIQRGDLATFVDRSELMLDDDLTTRIMADKALTFELFSSKGYRVPERCAYTMARLDDAEAFLTKHPQNVVVKPASGTGGGRGVTTGISTVASLHNASKHAAGFNPNLLVEEQLTGNSYRLLYLDGTFIDAVRRDAPMVVGDGQLTVRQLIAKENQRRRTERPITALSPLIVDKDCRNTLAQKDLNPNSRPLAGETIQVKTAVNENAAAQNHNVRDDIHPTAIEAGAKLVSDLGVRFAGVDLTSDDISAPLDKSNAFFNEINVNPGIHHHYLIGNLEKGAPVATLILEHLFLQRQGVMVL